MQSSNAAVLQSANLYVYTVNNPVRWVDPSGLAKESTLKSPHGGGGIGLGGGVVMGMSGMLIVNSMVRTQDSMAVRAAAAADTIAAAVVDTGRNAARALTNLYRAVTDVIARPSPPEALTVAHDMDSISATGVLNQQQILDMERALDAVDADRLHDFRFFEAFRPHGAPTIIIGRAMTFDQAMMHIDEIKTKAPYARGVFAFTVTDALWLAHVNGGANFDHGGFIHGDGAPGFFLHFHTVNRPHAHIWFLGP